MDLGKAPKKLSGGPAPDLEEAFEVRVCRLCCCCDMTAETVPVGRRRDTRGVGRRDQKGSRRRHWWGQAHIGK